METDVRLTGKTRAICFFVLLVALGCNVTVLFVPFMDFRQLLSPTTYTFFTTVGMLWTEKLYALAFLVVGFSLLFPFFKLGVLFSVVLTREPGPIRLKLLNRVEMLAKWSMLDVFLVCLVLTLTSGQVLVSASPRGGVPIFIAAIVLSMIVGQILGARLLNHTSHARHLRMFRVEMKPIGRLLLVLSSGVLLFGALLVPFLKIEAWFLVNDSFSIVSVLPALWKQDSYAAVFAVGIFLILFPLIRWGVLLNTNVGLVLGRPKNAHKKVFALARFWSMLDVFALALGVFLIEGSRFVPADAKVGSALLVLLVFVNVWVERVLEANPGDPEKENGSTGD